MNNRYKENNLNLVTTTVEYDKDEFSEFIVSVIKTDIKKNLHDEYEEENERPNLCGDRINILLLTFLYFMQGIVSGLSAAMPLLLQNFGSTFTEQAHFSMAVWPFSLKLLWAPIIDSLYSKRFGRRKSWLIPTQYLIGIFMLLLSHYVKLWLTKDAKPNIKILTLLYFGLNFLAASLDITTDGWAIQLLKRCNVGYIATCNQCGQKTGFFIGFAMFTALESAEFCNKYLRSIPQTSGIVTLSGFLCYGGICFLCTTTFIALFKREADADIASDPSKFNMMQSYKILFHILKIPAVRQLVLILLTSKLAFAVSDNVVKLKLLDAGVKKDNLLILIILSMIPTEIILPLIITKYTTGSKPTETYIKFIPFRIIFSVAAVLTVWQTPSMIKKLGDSSIYLLILLFVIQLLYDTTVNAMYLGMTAFFAKVSDPNIGATYMTLWNTAETLGATWPGTISLYMIDTLTWRKCDPSNQTNHNGNFSTNAINNLVNSTHSVNCEVPAQIPLLHDSLKHCLITVDGFYIESIICLVCGVIWYFWVKPKIRRIQKLEIDVWRLAKID